MSISDVRDAFNAISLPHGIRCTDARLSYCDKSGSPDGPRDHQLVVFDCVNAKDNSAHQYASDPLPPGTNPIHAAQTIANKVIGP